MSNTQTMKTAGLNTDGTSRLSVTKKKKSKSRWIIPAIIGGAALFAGIGGMSAASGSSGFLSSLKNIGSNVGSGIGKIFGLGGNKAGAAAISGMVAGPHDGSGIMSTGGSALKATNALSTASDSGWFSKMFSSIGNMSGSQMIGLGSILSAGGSTLSALFSDDSDLLAEEQRQFDERMEYNYAALDAEMAIADATINLKNRQNALAGTFMGYTNPVVDVEGIASTEGYTPSKAASIPEIHPTGLLSQAEQTS